MRKYLIRNFVDESAMTLEDGQPVYERVHADLKEGATVELDFSGVCYFASPFFNVAIGQLFRDFSSDELNRQLSIVNLSPVGRNALERVIKNSKPSSRTEATQKIVDDIINQVVEFEA